MTEIVEQVMEEFRKKKEWDSIWEYLATIDHLHIFGWKEAGWVRITTKKNEYNINDSYSLHRVKQIVKLAEEDNKSL